MTVSRYFLLALLVLAPAAAHAAQPAVPPIESADFLLPDESKMTPFKDRVPVVFVTANQPEWKTLKSFWNEGATQDDVNPATGAKVTRKVVKLKVPLGLAQRPWCPPRTR